MKTVFFLKFHPHLAPNSPEENSIRMDRNSILIQELRSYLYMQGFGKYIWSFFLLFENVYEIIVPHENCRGVFLSP